MESEEATRRDLLGVVVTHWDDAVAAAVGALDPSVALVVTDGTAIGEQRALPALPSGIHHLALCYETREGFGDLPVVAGTAQAMKGDRQKCIQAGASDYVSKPVDIDHLTSVLRVGIQRTDALRLARDPVVYLMPPAG